MFSDVKLNKPQNSSLVQDQQDNKTKNIKENKPHQIVQSADKNGKMKKVISEFSFLTLNDSYNKRLQVFTPRSEVDDLTKKLTNFKIPMTKTKTLSKSALKPVEKQADKKTVMEIIEEIHHLLMTTWCDKTEAGKRYIWSLNANGGEHNNKEITLSKRVLFPSEIKGIEIW